MVFAMAYALAKAADPGFRGVAEKQALYMRMGWGRGHAMSAAIRAQALKALKAVAAETLPTPA